MSPGFKFSKAFGDGGGMMMDSDEEVEAKLNMGKEA